MCFNGAVVLLHVEGTSGPWLRHWKLGQISCEDSVVVRYVLLFDMGSKCRSPCGLASCEFNKDGTIFCV